ncbi:MAG: CHAT domain-containing protein, partial [Planctomycetaceae bacterium]
MVDELSPRPAVIVLAIVPGDTGLGQLPFELLHDGTQWCHARTSRALVPVRFHRQPTATLEPPLNRPLGVLFMAASPQVPGRPLLDYEAEEARILDAAGKAGAIELIVEESGTLSELKLAWDALAMSPPDVLHLTCHAGHAGDEPVFELETLEGALDQVTPDHLSLAFSTRPRLAFFSGCRTAQAPRTSDGNSLAERLIRDGWPAVLGWGNNVGDTQASFAAEQLYGQLDQGESLPIALLRTWLSLREKRARHWHLLRLHCDNLLPDRLVTPRTQP